MQDNQLSPTALDDIDKTMQGLLALVRYLKVRDEVTASLSLFLAKSATVRQGEVSEYALKLVNNSKEHLWLGLLVDIYARENQVHPEGHHAYFQKDIFVPSRSSRELGFHYNWQDSAAFVIDGISFAPDSAWSGPCNASASYVVWARLYWQGGELIEELPLLQRLA